MQCQPERAVQFVARQFGPGKLSENVGLCACSSAASFIASCSCFVPLEPPYNTSRNENYRCNGRKGPTRDPLQACSAGLRSCGASLGCLYLSDLRLIAREGLLSLLALASPRAPMTVR